MYFGCVCMNVRENLLGSILSFCHAGPGDCDSVGGLVLSPSKPYSLTLCLYLSEEAPSPNLDLTIPTPSSPESLWDGPVSTSSRLRLQTLPSGIDVGASDGTRFSALTQQSPQRPQPHLQPVLLLSVNTSESGLPISLFPLLHAKCRFTSQLL